MSALASRRRRGCAAGLGAGATVSRGPRRGHARRRPRERIAEALRARARDAGYDFLCDLAATDYLGFGGEGVAGYWAARRARARATSTTPARGASASSPTPPGDEALRGLLPAARPLGPARAAPARCASGSTTASRVPSVVGVFPCADYQEREAWDLMGIDFERPPEPRAHLPARGLGRPPAPQGLSHRRRARPVLGRGLMSALADRRTPRYPPAEVLSPIPSVLIPPPTTRTC